MINHKAFRYAVDSTWALFTELIQPEIEADKQLLSSSEVKKPATKKPDHEIKKIISKV
jgi:hypothetical protein